MAGHTGVGVYPESFKESDLHLSISQVAELQEVEYDKKKIVSRVSGLNWNSNLITVKESESERERAIWSKLKKVKVKKQSDQS